MAKFIFEINDEQANDVEVFILQLLKEITVLERVTKAEIHYEDRYGNPYSKIYETKKTTDK